MCAVTLDDAHVMFVNKDIKTYVVRSTKEYLSTTTLLGLRFESSRRSNFFSHVFKRNNLVFLTIHTAICEAKKRMIQCGGRRVYINITPFGNGRNNQPVLLIVRTRNVHEHLLQMCTVPAIESSHI